MPIVVSEGAGPRKIAPKSVNEHVELVQSLFMQMDIFDALKGLWQAGNRKGFSKKILELMLPASAAGTIEELRQMLQKTANEEEVKAIQRMLFSMMDLAPPPAMSGAVWAMEYH